jgi:hypothetical protein
MGHVCTGWNSSSYLYKSSLPFPIPNLPQHLPIWRRFRSASRKGMFFVSALGKVNALLRYVPPSLYLETSYISRSWPLLFHSSPVRYVSWAAVEYTYFSYASCNVGYIIDVCVHLLHSQIYWSLNFNYLKFLIQLHRA